MISLLGRSESPTRVDLRLVGHSGLGRDKIALEYEMDPVRTCFDGSGIHRTSFVDPGVPREGGSWTTLSQIAEGLTGATPYHWRVRVVTGSPFFPHSPWFSLPFNGSNETDFRTQIISASLGNEVVSRPDARLEACRPNPASGSVSITYALPTTGPVSLEIYDVSGRRVDSLVHAVQSPGRHDVTWNGEEGGSLTSASGTYFVRGSHGADNLPGGQHAHLHRGHGEIAPHRLQLGGHHLGRHGVHGFNPLAVLDGEGSDHREAVNPQEGGGFQILLQAGARSGVGAGND